MSDSKHDFRVVRTRASIKNALLELLNTKELQEITVKELTEKAQCNRNTFYLHYVDKYDLIEKLCTENIRIMQFSLQETYNCQYSSNKDWYADIAKRCLDVIEWDMVFYKLVLGRGKYPNFADQLQQLLADFISVSLNQAGKKPKRLEVEFSVNGMVGVVRYWLVNQEEYTKEAMAAELNYFVVRLGSVLLG